jgi:hypothetical protein
MKATVGDRIVVVPSTMEHHVRDGRILEVRGQDGEPPYLVEWDDNGHQALVFPGPDAHVQHFGPDGLPVPPPREPIARKRSWQVDLAIVERDGQTVAHATLVGDVPAKAADGQAHLNPTDRDVPALGDEIAVARALRRLADSLLSDAAADITAAEHKRAHLAPR